MEPPLLPGGHFPVLLVRQGLRAQGRQHGAVRGSPVPFRKEPDGLLPPDIGGQGGRLELDAGPAAYGHAAAVIPPQSLDALQRRGFPRAVYAYDRGFFVVLYVKRYIPEYGNLVK